MSASASLQARERAAVAADAFYSALSELEGDGPPGGKSCNSILTG
jgi:hypothetical protein